MKTNPRRKTYFVLGLIIIGFPTPTYFAAAQSADTSQDWGEMPSHSEIVQFYNTLSDPATNKYPEGRTQYASLLEALDKDSYNSPVYWTYQYPNGNLKQGTVNVEAPVTWLPGCRLTSFRYYDPNGTMIDMMQSLACKSPAGKWLLSDTATRSTLPPVSMRTAVKCPLYHATCTFAERLQEHTYWLPAEAYRIRSEQVYEAAVNGTTYEDSQSSSSSSEDQSGEVQGDPNNFLDVLFNSLTNQSATTAGQSYRAPRTATAPHGSEDGWSCPTNLYVDYCEFDQVAYNMSGNQQSDCNYPCKGSWNVGKWCDSNGTSYMSEDDVYAAYCKKSSSMSSQPSHIDNITMQTSPTKKKMTAKSSNSSRSIKRH